MISLLKAHCGLERDIKAGLLGANHSHLSKLTRLAAGEAMTPLERLASTPKGQLKNPYADFASVAEEGHKIYMSLQ